MNARDPNPPLAADQAAALAAFADQAWDERIVPALTDYIRVPAKSPMFDADWRAHGHLDRVVRDAAAWVESRRVAGLRLEVLRLEGRTPLIFFDVPAAPARPAGHGPDARTRRDDAIGAESAASGGSTRTVVFYGHLDKQPEFSGWRSGLGPWTPKLEDGKLYGRGGADDGYAVYAAISAIEALDAQGIGRPRCVGIIEASEESGSPDLPAYLELLRPRLGDVGLVVCLDSGAGSWEQLWLTTSLRGMASGVLRVQVLDEGIHSGDASGVVPSSFRILRHVLDRLEDSASGELLPRDFHCEIPLLRVEQARAAAAVLKDEVYKRLPWACGADGAPVLPTTTDPVQVLLNRTWKPTLSVTGADGIPALASAGNVLRPHTAFKLSLRLPPLVDGAAATQRLKALLEDNAPYNAKVTFHPDDSATGWNAPALAPWLERALNEASQAHWGAPLGYIGQGGTIPLMSLLQAGFPAAQMMVCGVLGPKSNAHGPNEFLHLGYGKKLTAAVAQVVAACP